MSTDIPDGLTEIRRHWSFRDTLDGHIAQDAIDEGRRAMQPQQEE